MCQIRTWGHSFGEICGWFCWGRGSRGWKAGVRWDPGTSSWRTAQRGGSWDHEWGKFLWKIRPSVQTDRAGIRLSSGLLIISIKVAQWFKPSVGLWGLIRLGVSNPGLPTYALCECEEQAGGAVEVRGGPCLWVPDIPPPTPRDSGRMQLRGPTLLLGCQQALGGVLSWKSEGFCI